MARSANTKAPSNASKSRARTAKAAAIVLTTNSRCEGLRVGFSGGGDGACSATGFGGGSICTTFGFGRGTTSSTLSLCPSGVELSLESSKFRLRNRKLRAEINPLFCPTRYGLEALDLFDEEFRRSLISIITTLDFPQQRARRPVHGVNQGFFAHFKNSDFR